MRSRALSLLPLAATALLLPAATAPAAQRPESARTTFLLSRAHDGGFPNGPSRNPAVSHDQRIARVMAYESDASNIVAGDTNGVTDVVVVHRGGSWGRLGTPWEIGRTELASRGLGGQPANGRSYNAALDGDSHNTPSCVAFVSEASNLVKGDTNGKADAFVRDLRSGKVTRVSVDGSGRQAKGTTYDVTVDGDCERVAFTSDAANLALAKTKKLAWSTARTSRPHAGLRQVYVRVLRGKKHDEGFSGLTFLASASAKGKAANGACHSPAFGRAGKAVVFVCEATNLVAGDRSPGADIYKRAFERRFQHLGHGKGVQALYLTTTLVSTTRAGKAGNGPSTHPSVTDDGRYVAFETLASNLLPGDRNGVSDVARGDTKGKRPVQRWVSKSGYSGVGNGASNRPVISGAGEFVLFDSEADNLKPSASVRDDPNGVRDVFLWNAPTGNVSLESRDSENGYIATASQGASTSSRGNYVPFESANPVIDVPFAARTFPALLLNPELVESIVPNLIPPGLSSPELSSYLGSNRAGAPGAGAGTSASPATIAGLSPLALQQVYLRYLGPK